MAKLFVNGGEPDQMPHSMFVKYPFVGFHTKFIVLGFKDMSTLVGHFVLSPRKREKR